MYDTASSRRWRVWAGGFSWRESLKSFRLGRQKYICTGCDWAAVGSRACGVIIYAMYLGIWLHIAGLGRLAL